MIKGQRGNSKAQAVIQAFAEDIEDGADSATVDATIATVLLSRRSLPSDRSRPRNPRGDQ
jgi:hypothetical protein